MYVLDVCLNVLWDRRCVWSCPADSLPLTLSWHGRRSETAGAQAEGVYLPPPAAKEKRSTKESSWMGSHWGSLPKVLYVGRPFKHGTFCLFLITAEAFGTYNRERMTLHTRSDRKRGGNANKLQNNRLAFINRKKSISCVLCFWDIDIWDSYALT